MNKTLLLLLFSIFLVACNKSENHKNEKLKSAEWLLGNWENKSEVGNLIENWKKINDSTYNGVAYFIKGTDTLHFESIVLNQVGEDLQYIPTVNGQNDDKPITFKLITTTEKQLIFENQAHDYPQKIVYNKITNDSMVTSISGKQQGKVSQENYSMKKK